MNPFIRSRFGVCAPDLISLCSIYFCPGNLHLSCRWRQRQSRRRIQRTLYGNDRAVLTIVKSALVCTHRSYLIIIRSSRGKPLICKTISAERTRIRVPVQRMNRFYFCIFPIRTRRTENHISFCPRHGVPAQFCRLIIHTLYSRFLRIRLA